MQAVGLRCSGNNQSEDSSKDELGFKTYLNTYCEIVFLDPLKVKWLVDFHICVRPTVVLTLLEVERVVLVGLVGGASDQLVEYGWVVLYTRAGWGNRLGVGPY